MWEGITNAVVSNGSVCHNWSICLPGYCRWQNNIYMQFCIYAVLNFLCRTVYICIKLSMVISVSPKLILYLIDYSFHLFFLADNFPLQLRNLSLLSVIHLLTVQCNYDHSYGIIKPFIIEINYQHKYSVYA